MSSDTIGKFRCIMKLTVYLSSLALVDLTYFQIVKVNLFQAPAGNANTLKWTQLLHCDNILCRLSKLVSVMATTIGLSTSQVKHILMPMYIEETDLHQKQSTNIRIQRNCILTLEYD